MIQVNFSIAKFDSLLMKNTISWCFKLKIWLMESTTWFKIQLVVFLEVQLVKHDGTKTMILEFF